MRFKSILLIVLIGAAGVAAFFFIKRKGLFFKTLFNQSLTLDDRINISLDQVLKNEGGLVNNPADSGGLTKYGISQKWHPDLDIENLTKEDAKRIMYKEYVIPMMDFIRDVDLNETYQIIDMAINAGVSRCKQLLSKVTPAYSFKDARIDFYNSIATGAKAQFLKGWLKRVSVVL